MRRYKLPIIIAVMDASISNKEIARFLFTDEATAEAEMPEILESFGCGSDLYGQKLEMKPSRIRI